MKPLLPRSLIIALATFAVISCTRGKTTTISADASTVNQNLNTVSVKPTFGGVLPSSASKNGGSQVSISGSNFVSGIKVYFGTTPSSQVTLVSSTQLAVSVPVGSLGATDITLVNPGNLSVTASKVFTYTNPLDGVVTPKLFNAIPASGPPSGGTGITIAGQYFQSGMTVSVGSSPCTNVVVLTDGQATCTVGRGTEGPANIVVQNPDGGAALLSPGFYYVPADLPAPTIISVSPTSGPIPTLTNNTAVTINGSNFVSGATVQFDGIAGTQVSVVSSSTLTVLVPVHPLGAADVKVINPDGKYAILSQGFTYTPPAPVVSGINPSSGSTAGGTPVTISGQYFQSTVTVSLGLIPCTNPSATSTSITCTAGASSTEGVVSVTVVNADGQSGTLSNAFTYSKPVSSPASTIPVGVVDAIDQNGVISGWAGDFTAPGASVNVLFYAGGAIGQGTLVGTAVTSTPRPDVNSARGFSGNHGFQFQIPANLRDGNLRSIFIYVVPLTPGVPNQLLTNGSRLYRISGSNFVAMGYLDTIGSDGVARGWAIDLANPGASIDVHFYIDGPAGGGGTFMGYTTANIADDSLNAFLGGVPGAHRFQFAIPAQFRDGDMHTMWAHGISLSAGVGNPLINGSPKFFRFNASGSMAMGWVDGVDATGTVTGWAIDLANAAASTDVHFYLNNPAGGANATFMGLAHANIADSALNGVLGVTGSHRFAFRIPDQFRDSAMHVFYAHGISLTPNQPNPVLNGSPKYFNFGPSGAIGMGWVDTIDTNGYVVGWALDQSNSAASVTVHFYLNGPAGTPGAVFAGAADATIPDQNLNNVLGVTGSHRFAFRIPDQFRDRTLHTIYAHVLSMNQGRPNPVIGFGKMFNMDSTGFLAIGFLDSISSTGLASGWAVDQSNPNVPTTVHLYYEGPAGTGKFLDAVAANQQSDDLVGTLGIPGAHRFTYQLPPRVRFTRVYAYGITLRGAHNPLLANAPLVYR